MISALLIQQLSVVCQRIVIGKILHDFAMGIPLVTRVSHKVKQAWHFYLVTDNRMIINGLNLSFIAKQCQVSNNKLACSPVAGLLSDRLTHAIEETASLSW